MLPRLCRARRETTSKLYEFDSAEEDEIDSILLYLIVGGVHKEWVNGQYFSRRARPGSCCTQSVAVRRCGGNERTEVRNENPRICCRRFAISLKRTLCPYSGYGWLSRYANGLGAIPDASARWTSGRGILPSGLRHVRRGYRFSDGLLPNLHKRAVRRSHHSVHRLLAHNNLRSVHRYKNMLHGLLVPRRGLYLLSQVLVRMRRGHVAGSPILLPLGKRGLTVWDSGKAELKQREITGRVAPY